MQRSVWFASPVVGQNDATAALIQDTASEATQESHQHTGRPSRHPAFAEEEAFASTASRISKESWVLRRCVGLFRLVGRRYPDLNGVNAVGLCGVHGDYSKTAVCVAHSNDSRGLRSGRAWAYRFAG